MLKKSSTKKIILCLFILLIFILLLSLFSGRYPLKPSELIKLLKSRSDITANSDWNVFFYIRLPRIILVMGVGAALAATGAAYQSIFRNPLVSPGILGVASGACFGVALGLLFAPSSLIFIYIMSFIMGIVAVILTYGISLAGNNRGVMILVLAGIVVSSLFNALISILKYLADPYQKLPGIIFWLMGGFSRTGWEEVFFTIPFLITGLIVLYIFRWYLNIMSLGKEETINLGIDISCYKVLFIIFSTLMVATSVATAGQVTWIGLVVPHLARYLVGSNHRFMLPVSALLGSSLLLLMDDLARNISSAEVPISIITALLGAPFFIYLLISKRESGWS